MVPNDWAGFLRQRLDSNDLHAPEVAGINALSGYKLTYTAKSNYWSQLAEGEDSTMDARWSLGFTVNTAGAVGDVIMDSVAWKAGLAPAFQIVAVNGRAFTTSLLHTAIQNAEGSGPPIELIVENTGYYKTLKLDYHDGEKYPQLERVPNTHDRLDDILEPMTK